MLPPAIRSPTSPRSGTLDNQAFPDDAYGFEDWREQVEPVALSACQIKVGQSCPVFIYTHKHEWITGSVTRYGYDVPCSSVVLVADGIESGTSGSPVVTADGLLLGIVSNSHEPHATSEACGMMPVAHMALPQWVLARIGLIR